MAKKLEKILEFLLFNSRWLLVPFFLGLVLTVLLLLVKFIQEFFHFVPLIFSASGSELIITVLSLVDLTLMAILLLIIVFSGYEHFVSKIDTGDHEDRPGWMGTVDFSGLKIKLIGSIVAISAIELLKVFVNIGSMSEQELKWKVGIHLTFVISGVLFAVMDRLSFFEKKK